MSQTVLITGASTGLGLATALHLAERGFTVYAALRNPEQAAKIEAAAAARGTRLRPVTLDITNATQIQAAVETIVSESGGIDALVNNAGIGLRGYFEDLQPAEIEQLFAVNLFGTMAVTRAVLPAMRQAGRGRIIIITSVGGHIASLGLSSYCASKFAQEGFGEALYQELQPFGIHVSLVAPAIIKTERWGQNRGTAAGAAAEDSPYRALFLASEAAADRLVQSSPTRPDDVARCVERILMARRPALRYVVGRRARVALWLKRFLPERFFERLYFGTAIRHVTRRAGQTKE